MKVLLVNDCALESIIFKDILISMDYDVKITNEYNALIELERYCPDVVIANLIMKDTTGDELIKHIKLRDNRVKCILSSSCENKLNEARNNIDGILTTPVSKEKVKKALCNLECKNSYDDEKVDSILNGLSEKASMQGNNANERIDKKTDENNGFSFCPYCGGKLKSNTDKFKFCPYCGGNLNI